MLSATELAVFGHDHLSTESPCESIDTLNVDFPFGWNDTFHLLLNRQLTHRTVRTQDFLDFWVLGGLRANRTLLVVGRSAA
jgi:hypothetical protein